MSFKSKAIKKRNYNFDASGFTLIEVLMALVIFSVGVLGLIQMQIASIDANAKARKRSEILVAAQKQIEEIMQDNYATITAGETPIGHSTDATIPENYTLKYDVSDVSISGASKYKKIKVSLSHVSGSKFEPSVEITFLRAQDF